MARRRLGDYLRPPLMAEQLVEVPTIVSYSSLFLRTAEQIIDIPVPQDRGVCGGEGGLQGFSPGLGSTAYSGADLVDIPVPGSGGGEVLVEVFKVLAQDWIQQCFVEQIQQRLPSKSLIFQFCMVPLPIFIKILLRLQVLLVCWIWQIKGFFALFPGGKKVPVWVRTLGRKCMRSRAHPCGELMAGWSLWWGSWTSDIGWTNSAAAGLGRWPALRGGSCRTPLSWSGGKSPTSPVRVQFLGKVVDMPIVMQFFDKVAYVPVVRYSLCDWVQIVASCQRSWRKS